MNIDHIHFYVEDAVFWRNWFVQVLGFHASDCPIRGHSHTEILHNGGVCIWLSSPLTEHSPVVQYLQRHPPGVVDVAFAVGDLAVAMAQVPSAQILTHEGNVQIKGWGDLRHTLVEKPVEKAFVSKGKASGLINFDHVVLNVAKGELQQAIAFYEQTLGFQRQQTFAIRTDRSGLCSQVLTHADGNAKLPINEPRSEDSQIQEFLNHNRGAGIQHVALRTGDIVEEIAQWRQRGLAFLTVPQSYYQQLQQRPGFSLTEQEWRSIARQEILVDWQEDNARALLLQAFTQPIFGQPTFFFELIERRTYWTGCAYGVTEGFGEANFQALFEAMEREQMKRDSLGASP